MLTPIPTHIVQPLSTLRFSPALRTHPHVRMFWPGADRWDHDELMDYPWRPVERTLMDLAEAIWGGFAGLSGPRVSSIARLPMADRLCALNALEYALGTDPVRSAAA